MERQNLFVSYFSLSSVYLVVVVAACFVLRSETCAIELWPSQSSWEHYKLAKNCMSHNIPVRYSWLVAGHIPSQPIRGWDPSCWCCWKLSFAMRCDVFLSNHRQRKSCTQRRRQMLLVLERQNWCDPDLMRGRWRHRTTKTRNISVSPAAYLRQLPIDRFSSMMRYRALVG